MDDSSEVSAKSNTPTNQLNSRVMQYKMLIVLLVAVFAMGAVGIAAGGIFGGRFQQKTDKTTQNTPENPEQNSPYSADESFVYGYWAGSKSEVRSIGLSNGKISTIASLPLNIKHIRIISPQFIVYIAETDEEDYGSKIVKFDTKSKQETAVVSASQGVRIDDYRISPDGNFISTWEVAKPLGSAQLFDGISRVYITNTSTKQKNLLYDETANVPVHYPVAVTNVGTTFMDTFLPNDGVGWAYGMSMSNFEGTQKKNLEEMTNGTYGSQPVLSPDGSKLLFAGYDGVNGDGKTVIGGIRRSIISSNTVEMLDVNSLVRTKLTNLSNEHFYPKVWWNELNGEIILSLISKKGNETGTYSYNLANNSYVKLVTGNDALTDNLKMIAKLDDGFMLVGRATDGDNSIGNLGGQYDQPIDGLYVVGNEGKNTVRVQIEGVFLQTIALKPRQYFEESAQGIAGDSKEGVTNDRAKQLQLQTFTLKPSLAPKRSEQQSQKKTEIPTNPDDPRNPGGKQTCKNMATQACLSLLGVPTEEDFIKLMQEDSYLPGNVFNQAHFNAIMCYKEQAKIATQNGCFDSPLYLYGDKGKEVVVKSGTPLHGVNAYYHPQRGFVGSLTGNGGIKINNAVYSSIEFDYEPSIISPVPLSGVLISRNELDDKLTQYASALGMNQKETNDFIRYVTAHTISSQIFISHYSNEISKKILPLFFNPEPDSYSNIVFYIDDRGKDFVHSSQEPTYEKIQRKGYHAVEISYQIVR